MHKAKIIATASRVPPLAVSNDRLSELVETSDEWISQRTGIRSRFISEGENTSDLCTAVARQLLERASMKPADIDLIITATISADYLTPSVACMVQGAIGAVNAFAFDIGAACSGFVYAVSVATRFIETGRCKNVMVIGGEVTSKLIDWNDRNTCVLFGDGCGGVIMTAGDYGVCAEELGSDGTGFKAITAGYSSVENAFNGAVGEGTHRFDYLKMNGRDTYEFATRTVPQNISRLMEKAGVGADDIETFILHQANLKIINVVARNLGIPSERFFVNIDKYSNTVAATIPIALDELVTSGALQLGSRKKIVLVGFGSGLTYGSILVEI